MEEINCFSNGKLLITGEYLVLNGGLAFAVPLKYGQSLDMIVHEEDRNDLLSWSSLVRSESWFEAAFHTQSFDILTSSDAVIAEKLKEILVHCRTMNPDFIPAGMLHEISTDLEFDRNWGWGSSSTLISNLAYLADINPYQLLEKTFGGSGYDIACARTDQPLFYQNQDGFQMIQPLEYDPEFKEQLFFVYQGQKKQSKEGIIHFRNHYVLNNADLEEVESLGRQIVYCNGQSEFNALITEHEKLIASVLQLKPVKEIRFPDFDGAIKSLGAWGGDFILASSDNDEKSVREYFKDKGLETVFNYSDIVLS